MTLTDLRKKYGNNLQNITQEEWATLTEEEMNEYELEMLGLL